MVVACRSNEADTSSTSQANLQVLMKLSDSVCKDKSAISDRNEHSHLIFKMRVWSGKVWEVQRLFPVLMLTFLGIGIFQIGVALGKSSEGVVSKLTRSPPTAKSHPPERTRAGHLRVILPKLGKVEARHITIPRISCTFRPPRKDWFSTHKMNAQAYDSFCCELNFRMLHH